MSIVGGKKSPSHTESKTSDSDVGYKFSDNSAIPMEDPEVGHGWRERAQRAVGRLGIEQRGIERVPEDERSDFSITNMGSLVSHITTSISPLFTLLEMLTHSSSPSAAVAICEYDRGHICCWHAC